MLLVILYSQVLSGILVPGNRAILFVCFFVYILREVKCKYILIYIYIYIYIYIKISSLLAEGFVEELPQKELVNAFFAKCFKVASLRKSK